MRRPSLWFVVPAHGRHDIAAICLRQLRRTCDALIDHGIDAHAVIVADQDNLRELRRRLSRLGRRPMLGFATVPRDNTFVSRKFNDGIQLALDGRFNPRPADYVVPCGSDDWVDHHIFRNLPHGKTIVGFQRISFVREDGREMTSRFLNYEGGCGIRIYPRNVMAPVGFRPADPDRKRACDTSILTNLRRIHGDSLRVEHRDIDPRQIVDWKSPGQQLNSYESLRSHRSENTCDPFTELAGVYPAEALHEMDRHYRLNPVPVAA